MLATELADGPNADKEIRFDSDGDAVVFTDHDDPDGQVYYTATPLSFKAYTAIHRPMTGMSSPGRPRKKAMPTSGWVFSYLRSWPPSRRSPAGQEAAAAARRPGLPARRRRHPPPAGYQVAK